MVKALQFSEKQFDKLADIASNIGFLTLGSVILPATMNYFQIARVIGGIFATIFFWTISLILIKSK